MKILEKKKFLYEKVEYLKAPLSLSELKLLRKKLDLRPKEFIRIKEMEKLGLDIDLENDDEILKTIVEKPIILERPIIVSGDKAVIGRPPENLLKLL